MAEADVTVQVNAPYERVWRIISDVDNDPKYWKGMSSIRTISRERNSLLREVEMSDGTKYQQKITLFPKEGIHIRWTKGQSVGIRDIMLIDNGGATIVRIQTSFKASSQHTMKAEVVAKMQSEVELALSQIKKAAESKPQRISNESHSGPGPRGGQR